MDIQRLADALNEEFANWEVVFTARKHDDKDHIHFGGRFMRHMVIIFTDEPEYYYPVDTWMLDPLTVNHRSGDDPKVFHGLKVAMGLYPGEKNDGRRRNKEEVIATSERFNDLQRQVFHAIIKFRTQASDIAANKLTRFQQLPTSAAQVVEKAINERYGKSPNIIVASAPSATDEIKLKLRARKAAAMKMRLRLLALQ